MDAIKPHNEFSERIRGSYFAGIAFRNANLRIGADRKIAAAKKALNGFSVRVSVDERGELEIRSMDNVEILFSFSRHKGIQ